MLMIQGLMCENSSKAWRDIKKARLWFWRLFEVSYLRWNLTLIIASLTSAQSPLPSPPGFEVMTGHLLCGTRHLLSSVPCKARKINLHSANERLVNVCPEKTFFSTHSLSHTHTPQWVESTLAAVVGSVVALRSIFLNMTTWRQLFKCLLPYYLV